MTVSLGARSYPIIIGTETLRALPSLTARLGLTGKVGLVTDSNVGPLYGERVEQLLRDCRLAPVTYTMKAGESYKRLARIEEITGAFLEAGLDRGSTVFALGGGVVGDVAGYAAASFMRGIPYIQIPTTIVAQVDSSVGGKTGVNHPLSKNTIGAFHQPSAVVVDMTLLRTLPEREVRAGLAEVIKHGVIAEEGLFAHMEREASRILELDLDALEFPIRRSCEIKADIVGRDEREGGVRANLNYGHTFGHGIEAASNYQFFLHGEAVALGMICAGALSESLGMVTGEFCERQRACIEQYGLPVQWRGAPVDAIVSAMRRDKKVRAGQMKFIVADRIGHVVQRTDISEEQARAALEAIA